MSFSVVVSVGKESHSFELPSDQCRVEELQRLVEERTGVFVKNQKLIFKGKTLGGTLTAAECRLRDGAKILLISTSGQLQGPARPQAPKLDPSKSALVKLAQNAAPKPASTPANTGSMQARAAAWGKTGIIGLQTAGLQALPHEVLQLGAAVRVMDISGNSISELPTAISQLVGLSSLKLGGNRLHQDAIPWPCLAALSGLTQLSLESNALTALPEATAGLQQLRVLVLHSNAIESLPAGLQCLLALETLQVAGNRLKVLPAGIGSCSALLELDASSNQLVELPESMSQLHSLRVLKLSTNRINALPATMLAACTSLLNLQLQNNPLTLDKLRTTPGFEAYDARRKAKIDKQLDRDVLTDAASFSQGADEQQWERWGALNKPK